MLVRAKRIVAMGVMTLAAAVISLPVVSVAATSPTVTVLSPLTQGLRAPVKMVMDAAGNAYVADQRIGGVMKYDAYGSQISVIPTAAAPAGVALAQDGTLLVSQSSFVARYDVASGQEIGRISGDPMQSPVGIAVDNVTGYIYVADDAAGKVLVYNASGAFVQVLASGLLSPSGVAFEKVSRQVAVVETFKNSVRFFRLDGTLDKSVGNPVSTTLGTSVGVMQFAAPVAVAFEYSKDQSALLRMYVVDAFQNNVQVVDPSTSTGVTVAGTLKNYIGASGTANGQLMVPSDVAFDSVNSRLLVVNGFGNVTVYGIDGGKNPQQVDTVPPLFTVNPVPAEVSVDVVTISGSVEAGSAVQVSVSGSAAAGSVVYSGSASWNVQIAGLSAGVNAITVSAKDAAGNSSDAQVVTVNYLLPAPAVAITPVASVTKNSVITLTGTVDAGAGVVVTNQVTSVSGNAAVTGTSWSYDLVLADGLNNVKVTAQKVQSAASVATAVVTLDAVAPVLAVSALQNGSYTSSSVQNVSGTVADISAVTVTVNGDSVALAGNAFSVPVALVNGSNMVSVVAVDAAGNTTANSRTLYFDATRPNIAVAEPVDNSFTSASVLKVSGSVDKVSAVTVAGVAATVQDNSWSATVNLLAGANTVEIVATDLYGNSSSVKRSITLDASNPNLSIVSPAQDVATNVPNVLISGTVTDTSALSLEYALNGTVAGVSSANGVYSFNVDFAAEGVYPVAVTAKDAAGNASTVVRNVIYDITPPVFTLNKVAGAMPVKLSGTVEPGSSVVVKDGAVQVGTVSVADGSWNADLSGVSYTPENLLAVATDAAGNSTSQALSYNFPTGTVNSDGKPAVTDALRAIRIVVNQVTPTAQELASYDIGPLVNGKPNPNGKIEIVDAILILRKALGLKSW